MLASLLPVAFPRLAHTSPLYPPCLHRSKRPRRVASGGVLGAVAAEASEWGLELVSPPLKRANSLPVRAALAASCVHMGNAICAEQSWRLCSLGVLVSAVTQSSPGLPSAPSMPPAPLLQPGLEAAPKGTRPKQVSDRVALLKKALAGETAAAAAAAAAVAQPTLRPALLGVAADCEDPPSADDEDAVSALFELSASVC